MKNGNAYRLTADLLFYFAVACMFMPGIRGAALFSLLYFLAAALAAVLIAAHMNTALRNLALLLPFSAVLFLLLFIGKGRLPDFSLFLNRPFALEVRLLLFMLPAFIYLIIQFFSGLLSMKYWEYKRIFLVLMPVMLIMMMVALVTDIPTEGGLVPMLFDVPRLAAFILGACFLVFGVLALRNLRTETNNRLFYNLLDLSSVLLPVLTLSVGVLLMALAVIGFGYGLTYFYTWIGNLITRLVLFLKGLIHFAPAPTESTEESAESTAESMTIPSEQEGAYPETEPSGPNLPPIELHIPWLPILIVIAALVTAYLVYRYLKLHRPEEEGDDEFERGDRYFFRGRREERLKKTRGPAEQVRHIYRDYLRFINRHGIMKRSSDTSAEILEEAHPLIDTDADAKLRMLYLRARYGDPKLITREEARQAEEYLDVIKKAIQ